MKQIWIYTLLSILLVSLIALSGIVLLIFNINTLKKFQNILVSFAIGTLLGGAILHLIPESLEHDHHGTAPILVIISIVFFFVIEKYFHILRHHHSKSNDIKAFGPLNLFADGMHNFLDGILIAAAYKIDVPTGIIATLAVLAHELPQEIGDFAVLIQAGYTRKKALLYNLLSACSAFIGGIIILAFPSINTEISHYILPLAAGGFIYIALADLVPELNSTVNNKSSFFQILSLIAGVFLMWLLLDLHTLQH
ncbi:MAG: ZIP family metal transporter [Bacteroidales bacterium]|nr:ZIP family metal transporter [Bacteroidales bacterium]MBN2818867.1 ZIP family metal transporter [Bacteroidales bacterium]